ELPRLQTPSVIFNEADTNPFAPALLLAVLESGAHAEERGLALARAGKPQDQRPHQPEECDHRRHRITRQTDERCAADLSQSDRTPGLDGKPPEVEGTERLDGGFDVIFLADRNAAAGDNKVMVTGGMFERGTDGGLAVGQNAKIGDGGAEPSQQRREGIAVGVVNMA